MPSVSGVLVDLRAEEVARFPVFQVDCSRWVPAGSSKGGRAAPRGGVVHSTHKKRYSQGVDVWFCAACGMFGDQQLVGLARPCSEVVTPIRAEYLSRIERGLWPKSYSATEKARRAQKGLQV